MKVRVIANRDGGAFIRDGKLEERLRSYPLAAQAEAQRLRLEVARALAGNTRAVVQLGTGGDILNTYLLDPPAPEAAERNGERVSDEAGRGAGDGAIWPSGGEVKSELAETGSR